MLVGVGLRKSWLECVNDDMKKFGFEKDDGTTIIHPKRSRLFMRMPSQLHKIMENMTLNG